MDASCAATVFYATATGRIAPDAALVAVLTYNLLSFASQPLLGWFVNDVRTGRTWAIAGAGTTAAAFLLSLLNHGVWPAVVFAGVGNAVFHLGGGVTALRLDPGKATLPGLFVAPGAAGLAAGIWMGANQVAPWLPAVLLAAMIPALRTYQVPESDSGPRHPPMSVSAVVPVVVIVFGVVAARGLIGAGLALPWKADPALLWTLTGAVVAGKALGGLLADRFGRIAVGVGALVMSAPLLVAGPALAPMGIAGMLLFNLTMPVTLVALADALPERPGFAFGLTCLALIFGSLPFAVGLLDGVSPWAAGALSLCSAGVFSVGLIWGRGRVVLPLETSPQEVG